MGYIDQKNNLHILGHKLLPGTKTRINFNTAKHFTSGSVEVPVIVERAKKPGPVMLITGGLHGDEINGVEIVRQLISKKINKPQQGTIICIPVINIFGFLQLQREFPDGRDLNRMFPGSKNGALASRFAYQFTQEILPVANYCLDFHTGGASRFNAAQIRIDNNNKENINLAKIFNAPFTIYAKTISKSYREACAKKGIPTLLFEGGKSLDNNPDIAQAGINGTIRVLHYLGMLNPNITLPQETSKSILISTTAWIRAKYSGLLHIKIPIGKQVEKGEHIATITDPYGSFKHKVKAPNNGYIININQAPLVYQGDAIFHITKD